jgi:predicted branched-subunit amino acid permease
VSVLSSSEELITDLGIDATIPAAFLALLWPRLRDGLQRLVAAAGALVAVVLVPVSPAGVPIIAAAAAVILAKPWRASEGP